MALRTGHGSCKGSVRIEVLPADELPRPVPDERPPVGSVERRTDGTLATAAAAAEVGRRGGLIKAKRSRLARSLGLFSLTSLPAFSSYLKAADHFRRVKCRELAEIAGGQCGAGVSSMVASAALQLAASRYLYDKATESGDTDLLMKASRQMESSRQSLMAAHEIAIREAGARPKNYDPLSGWKPPPVDPPPEGDGGGEDSGEGGAPALGP